MSATAIHRCGPGMRSSKGAPTSEAGRNQRSTGGKHLASLIGDQKAFIGMHWKQNSSQMASVQAVLSTMVPYTASRNDRCGERRR